MRIFRATVALCAVVLSGVAVTGCASGIRTDVYTLSDRPPAASASYRIELDEAQSADLEATRLASQIDARMTRAGFQRVVDATADADVVVRFGLFDDGAVGSERRPDVGAGATYGTTTVSSSQSSIAGVPVPLTRSSSVSRSHGYGVSMGNADGSAERIERRYRLELSFVDDRGPSHKVTVSTTSTLHPLRDIAPCLVDAAFRDFPLGDRQQREIWLSTRDCRAG